MWLLSAVPKLRPVWGRFDHERPGFDATHLWVLLSVIALLIATAVVAYRSSRRARQVFTADSPAKLFRDLCRTHRLPLGSRRLLKRLAAARGNLEPACLFVDAQQFQMETLTAELQSSARELQRLHATLFG